MKSMQQEKLQVLHQMQNKTKPVASYHITGPWVSESQTKSKQIRMPSNPYSAC